MPLHPDALADLRMALNKGATVATLAARAGIERGTIGAWMRHGVPRAVVNWVGKDMPTQVAAYRRLVYVARQFNSGKTQV